MAEYLIQDTTLTGIADKIRPLLGLTGTMTPEQMQTNLTTEQANITAALAALAEKGVEVPEGANSNALAGLIAAIEAGGGAATGTITLANDGFLTSFCSQKVTHNLGRIPVGFLVLNTAYNNNANLTAGGFFLAFEDSEFLYGLLASSTGYSQKVLKDPDRNVNVESWRGEINDKTAPLIPHSSALYSANLPAGTTVKWVIW